MDVNRRSLAALQRRLATVKAAQPVASPINIASVPAPVPGDCPSPFSVRDTAPAAPEPRTMTRLLRRLYLIFIAEHWRK
jgi:hypothetical protein